MSDKATITRTDEDFLYHLLYLPRRIERLEKLGESRSFPKGIDLNQVNEIPDCCYGEIEQAILDHLKEHDYPKEVRIVCDNEDVAKEYRVVYNFWFAESKAARLNDGTWD